VHHTVAIVGKSIFQVIGPRLRSLPMLPRGWKA
jgi:hypothetical protein